jgi:uncharacterized protein (DUF1330 family)
VWLGSVRPKAPLGVAALVKLSCNAFQAEILEVTMIQLRIAAVAALILAAGCSATLASTDPPAALDPSNARLELLRQHPRFDSEPFVMANLLRFSGSDGGARYFQNYAPRALQLIHAGGGEVVWVGETQQVLVPGSGEAWDQLILVRWPSRRAFLRMLESAEYAELKNARGDALAETMMLLMSEVGRT